MNLMIVTNSTYLKYAYVFLFTFFENHEEEQVDIYLPYEQLSEDELSGLRNFVGRFSGKKLIPVYVGDEFKARVQSRNGIAVETYYRILAIDMLPKGISRILYMDVDMVVKGSVKELYGTELEGYAFAVCEDIFGKINGFHEANMRRLSIPKEYSYFNAGVMVFNLDYLRNDNAGDRLLDAIYSDFERYEYNDQDVINELYYDKLKYMSWERYDLPPAYYYRRAGSGEYLSYDELRVLSNDPSEFSKYKNRMEELYEAAAVIHYLGDTKPWSTTRADSAPYNIFDWAYKNACKRLNGTFDKTHSVRFFTGKPDASDLMSAMIDAASADQLAEVSIGSVDEFLSDEKTETDLAFITDKAFYYDLKKYVRKLICLPKGVPAGYADFGDITYQVSFDSNLVLGYDKNAGRVICCPVGGENLSYSAIACDEKYLYLAEAATGNIIRFSPVSGADKVYVIPESLAGRRDVKNRFMVHRFLISVGGSLITAPGCADTALVIDKEDGSVEPFIEDFWTEGASDYTCVYAGYLDEETLVFQRASDGASVLLRLSDPGLEATDTDMSGKYDEEILQKKSELCRQIYSSAISCLYS